MLPSRTITVVFNPGPGTLVYPGLRDGSVEDLVLRPWRHTEVEPFFLNNTAFRKDARAGKFEIKELADLPTDDHFQLAQKYEDMLSPQAKQMALRICSEAHKPDSRGMNMYRDLINLHEQIGENGKPTGQSRVTVKYLKDTHRYFLEAVLDLETRWQKRKGVIRDLRAALKKIENL